MVVEHHPVGLRDVEYRFRPLGDFLHVVIVLDRFVARVPDAGQGVRGSASAPNVSELGIVSGSGSYEASSDTVCRTCLPSSNAAPFTCRHAMSSRTNREGSFPADSAGKFSSISSSDILR